MAKIKLTKTELKVQRDALTRFRRFLPTLQLKKQSLQVEVRRLARELAERKKAEEQARAALASWVRLFAEPFDFTPYLVLSEIKLGEGNVVGVNTPTLDAVTFDDAMPDPYATPGWVSYNFV